MVESNRDDNASEASFQQWRRDMNASLRYARTRFGDVVWSYQEGGELKQIWGHKAMLLGRATPESKSWFDVDGLVIGKSAPSPPAKIAPLQGLFNLEARGRLARDDARNSAPGHRPPYIQLRSAATTMAGLCQEIQYLYTGINTKSQSTDAISRATDHERTIYALRADMLKLWTNRIGCDMSVTIGEQYSTTDPQDPQSSRPVFHCHRFVLASRSTYFLTALTGWLMPPTSIPTGARVALTLPSPPFSSMSLYFALGFIYTGTLKFGKRVFDLEGAFSIYRAGEYLGIPTLRDEVEAFIISEMLHTSQALPSYASTDVPPGVDATKPNVFNDSRICRCRQCTRRLPRVLAFSVAYDVQNIALENLSKMRLLALFGPGWCTEEFAALQEDTCSAILERFSSSINRDNVLGLLRLTKDGVTVLHQLDNSSWTDVIHTVLSTAQRDLDSFLAESPDIYLSTCRGNFDYLRLVFDSLERTATLDPLCAAKIYVALVNMFIQETRRNETDQAATEAETTASIVLATMGKYFHLVEATYTSSRDATETERRPRTYLAVVTADNGHGNLDIIDSNLIHIIEPNSTSDTPRRNIQGINLRVEVCDASALNLRRRANTRHFELVKSQLLPVLMDIARSHSSAPTSDLAILHPVCYNEQAASLAANLF